MPELEHLLEDREYRQRSGRYPSENILEVSPIECRAKIYHQLLHTTETRQIIYVTYFETLSPYLVQAGGHDQEGGRSLMAPVRDAWTVLTRVQDIVAFRSPLVETEILPSYPRYLEGVAHCLARSLKLFRVAHQTRHCVVHGDLE